MLVAATLFVSGAVAGLYFRVMLIFLASVFVVIASNAVWIYRQDWSWLKLLILFAYLTALQAGYLVGIYVRYRDDQT